MTLARLTQIVISSSYYSLGDLFDMLLPMLSIYQEYVRNHHYSLQVVSQNPVSLSLERAVSAFKFYRFIHLIFQGTDGVQATECICLHAESPGKQSSMPRSFAGDLPHVSDAPGIICNSLTPHHLCPSN